MIEKGRIVPIIKILKQGDEGSNVQYMQEHLKFLGEKWGVDAFKNAAEERGKFGAKTFKAVNLFQKVTMHLPPAEQNGVIDQKTWLEIIRQYNVMTGSERSYRLGDVFSPPFPSAMNYRKYPYPFYPASIVTEIFVILHLQYIRIYKKQTKTITLFRAC